MIEIAVGFGVLAAFILSIGVVDELIAQVSSIATRRSVKDYRGILTAFIMAAMFGCLVGELMSDLIALFWAIGNAVTETWRTQR